MADTTPYLISSRLRKGSVSALRHLGDIQVYNMGDEEGRCVEWNEDRTFAWELNSNGIERRRISLQESADFAASLNLSVPEILR